jgi:hypothetical protein
MIAVVEPIAHDAEGVEMLGEVVAEELTVGSLVKGTALRLVLPSEQVPCCRIAGNDA